jgi:hypothetical protein
VKAWCLLMGVDPFRPRWCRGAARARSARGACAALKTTRARGRLRVGSALSSRAIQTRGSRGGGTGGLVGRNDGDSSANQTRAAGPSEGCQWTSGGGGRLGAAMPS